MTGTNRGQAALRIRRDRSWFGFLVPYRIDVGIQQIGRLWSGCTIECNLDPGEHRVTVWLGGIRIGVETVSVAEAGSEYLLLRAQSTWRSFLGFGARSVTLRWIGT